jgi:hypothetical protein
VLLTTRARSVDIDTSADEEDVTAFGGDGWREFEPGLKQGQISVEFYADFAAGSVHATLWPIHEGDLEVEMRIGPQGDVGAADNPVFVGMVKLFGYHYLNGEVGAASTNQVTFRLTGAPTLDVGV